MVQRKLRISSDEGLQSGAAALLAQVAGRFPCGVLLELGNKRVNAKSIMGVLSLRLRKGDGFTVKACGEREQDAVDAISKLIETGEAG